MSWYAKPSHKLSVCTKLEQVRRAMSSATKRNIYFNYYYYSCESEEKNPSLSSFFFSLHQTTHTQNLHIDFFLVLVVCDCKMSTISTITVKGMLIFLDDVIFRINWRKKREKRILFVANDRTKFVTFQQRWLRTGIANVASFIITSLIEICHINNGLVRIFFSPFFLLFIISFACRIPLHTIL